jgi:hypothetical protein
MRTAGGRKWPVGCRTPTEKLIFLIESRGYEVVIICPAKGYWTHLQADCMRWTGYAKKDKAMFTLGGWDTITDCVAQGIEMSPGMAPCEIDVYVARPKFEKRNQQGDRHGRASV